jgi:hypothetical protein
MHDVIILPAPEIKPAENSERAWERERHAYFQLLPSLLSTHSGQYVAVHGGMVVASGSDRIGVALDAYRQVGYVPLYVGRVGEEPRRRVRIPSPRVMGSVTRS